MKSKQLRFEITEVNKRKKSELLFAFLPIIWQSFGSSFHYLCMTFLNLFTAA